MTASVASTAGRVEPDFSQGCAWVEGEYVPAGEARIPLLDWGFLRSDVTYDTVHAWHGSFFRLDDHLDRFARSCAALRLTPPLTRDGIRDVLTQCVRRAALRDAYVSMICTRGRPAPGSRDPRTARNSFFAFALPFVWVATPERQQRGVDAIISRTVRIPPPSIDPAVKNFHWGDLIRGLLEAYDRGAETVILVDLEGNISEGPGFNVFCVRDGVVVTPGGTVLEGITRRTVSELCSELSITFRVGPVTTDELRGADEVFLSSTAGGIMPVATVDGREIGRVRPGPVTLRLKERYWRWHDEGRYATPLYG